MSISAADTRELGRLAEPLRSRLHALLVKADGRVTITSGRRSVTEQIQLRRQHCGTSQYDIWQRPASQCSPPTAIPGRSQHNRGLAADLRGDLGLAARLAAHFGLHRPVRGENWHFEPTDSASGTLADFPGAPDLDLPDIDIPNPFGDGSPLDIGAMVESALTSALGAIVDPALAAVRRVTLWGLLLAGGVALVVMGGLRGTRTLTMRSST